ncbi:MAG: hypothetical protein GIS02_01415 [Methanosarcinales archaeon]|uniref:Uncharacterized protein n=1 Tax=Candidatus Ethanoperedens thermophilum TaxID=2766897 RepID=A0A848D983_9EURY|nr:hypothetical protein [Candidatus Ethanoperedens thermophilum]
MLKYGNNIVISDVNGIANIKQDTNCEPPTGRAVTRAMASPSSVESTSNVPAGHKKERA